MKKYMTTIMSIFLLLSIQNAFASDAVEADMLLELRQIDDLNVLMKEYQLAMEGYEAAMKVDIKSQLESITGVTDLGSLLNGETEQNDRKWSPSEWAQVVSGGNESRYQQLLEDYQTAHPTLSSSDASAGMSATYATDYQQQVETNQAASSQATYAFNESNTHLDNIKAISDEINKSEDTKHIQDLNARLNTEIAYLQVEVIKGIAVMNQQMAQQQATEIHDRTEAAKFNQIPTNES